MKCLALGRCQGFVTKVAGPHDDLFKKTTNQTNKHKRSIIWVRKVSMPLKKYKSDLCDSL